MVFACRMPLDFLVVVPDSGSDAEHSLRVPAGARVDELISLAASKIVIKPGKWAPDADVEWGLFLPSRSIWLANTASLSSYNLPEQVRFGRIAIFIFFANVFLAKRFLLCCGEPSRGYPNRARLFFPIASAHMHTGSFAEGICCCRLLYRASGC